MIQNDGRENNSGQVENQNRIASQSFSSVSSSESGGVVEVLPSEPSILVAVTNYGTQNDEYLVRLFQELRSMPWRLDVHVLTNIPKNWGPDVSVHVGLPTPNPRSLTFAHRRLFADNLAKADYLIYCEDDTLITERNIRAFMQVSRSLKEDEIPGFLRVERFANGDCFMESAHGPYRWDPASLVRRNSDLFASFTNSHSALTMATRRQVQKAIDSGGFLVAPHVGRFGMLECGANDMYTQCGMTRLICVSRIEDFLVPHLSNKNSLKWGLRYSEFLKQTRALERIEESKGWKGSLFEAETRMPRGWWSKNLYERPNQAILDLIPSGAKTILSIGTGWGETEENLARSGKNVTGVPIDAVFADCLRRRGIESIEGPLEMALAKLGKKQFDAVLVLDLLHLVPDPVRWLTMMRAALTSEGVIVASVPRTCDPLRLVWYFRGEPAAVPGRYVNSGVQKVTRSGLVKWFRAAGLDAIAFPRCNTPARIRLSKMTRGLGERFFADGIVLQARVKTPGGRMNPEA
jgi:2-polyprenyl-3-methyl-5-hydroxy-6-metoxy-1,4-benzoquinol methylase